MRFLENMVSSMIGESTGFSPRHVRRLVRRVGGGKLLLAGGAAVAGAMAAQRFSKSGGSSQGTASQSTASQGSTPPPPPPSGGPVPPDLPPLPPLPTSGEEAAGEAATDEGDEPEVEIPRELLFAMVRTMAAAALADGEMASEERSALEEHLDDSGLTDEQIRRVRKDLVLPLTPGELAEMVEDLPESQAADAREMLYRAAALIVRADRQVSDTEATWLGKLASELGLTAEEARTLEAEVFGADES